MTYPGSAIILTHAAAGTPHKEALRRSNPAMELHTVESEDQPGGKLLSWKNGDRPLRDWWQANSSAVSSEVVAVIEWDTLVTGRFPSLPDDLDLAGARLFEEPLELREDLRPAKMSSEGWEPSRWCWWPEAPLLGLGEGFQAVGLISFGCYLMRREVLDAISRPEWSPVFSRNIQNELRFPSVAKACGFRVGEVPLPFVNWHETAPTAAPGVYHSVKRSPCRW